MGSGDLRYRVSVYQMTREQSALGQAVEKPVLRVQVYAAIRDLSAHELITSGSLKSKLRTEIKTRYLPAVTASDVVEHDGKRYEVLDVLHNPRRTYTQILCTSGVKV